MNTWRLQIAENPSLSDVVFHTSSIPQFSRIYGGFTDVAKDFYSLQEVIDYWILLGRKDLTFSNHPRKNKGRYYIHLEDDIEKFKKMVLESLGLKK